MVDSTYTTRFRFWLWLIRLIGVIVPRRLRADWKQEWEAEFRYRELLLADWDKLNRRTKLDLLRRSLGAFWDAMVLQPERLEDEMFQDLRYGARMLLKKPAFTLVAVFTLALGVGASTAIFSAVNPILFEPLPYPHADRIAVILEMNSDGSRNGGTFGMYRGLVEQNRSFDGIAVFKRWQATLTGPDQPERLEGQRVSASYFQVLGVSPRVGRDFEDSDDKLVGPKTAIISDALWQRRFGGDVEIVGRQVTLDDELFTIIGVMPNGFENVLAPSAELWAPLQYDMSLGSAWGHHLRTVGRLRPGISMAEGTRELDVIAHAVLNEQHPQSYGRGVQLVAASLQDEVTRAVKPALLAVLGAVMLVLTIACVNVTNLLLARGAQRRGEFAVRAALGAARTRMIRQLLTESLLLAVFGGALGMVVAWLGIRSLVTLSPPGLPRVNAIAWNSAVFGFALGITTLVGLGVGLIPALHGSRSNLQTGLQQGSSRTAGGHQTTRRALVVAEVALALVLLVSAGLLLRSMERLFAIHPGFDAARALTMQVQTAGRRFDKETTDRFFAQSLEGVLRVRGVNRAAFTSQLPLSGDDDEYGAHFEGDEPNVGYGVFRYAVSPGYFETIGIPLVRGRLLDEHDGAGAPLALLISESLAKRKFPDRDPIGQRVQVGPPNRPWFNIVGIVGDVKQASLAASQLDAVYSTATQWFFADNSMSLVVRADGDAAALASDVKQAIWSIDKDQAIVRVATMEDLLAATAAERRFAMILFESFGLVALVLAAIGIYGVLSGNVTERTREIGVRLALGAQRGDVLGMILRQGFKLTLGGVGIGLLAAWAVTRLLTTLLYSVSATDPLIFGGVSLLLLSVSLLACYLPARRATKVDPLVALRQE